jgi:hypothetical protein
MYRHVLITTSEQVWVEFRWEGGRTRRSSDSGKSECLYPNSVQHSLTRLLQTISGAGLIDGAGRGGRTRRSADLSPPPQFFKFLKSLPLQTLPKIVLFDR